MILNSKSIVRSGVKGTTPEADVTSTSVDSATQALDVAVKQAALPGGAATDASLTNRSAKVQITNGTIDAAVLNSAPSTDTGQAGLAVRVISQLGAGDGGATETVNQGTEATSASAWFTRDDYQTGQVLADQSGADAVLTFTFSSAVHLAVLESTGTDLVSRGDPFGGTPSASLGIPLRDAVPVYVPVTTSSVKVYAPSGATVSVYGLRRT